MPLDAGRGQNGATLADLQGPPKEGAAVPEVDGSGPGLLGAYIRAQRQMADLTLRQLADMTDISNAYLSQVERGLHQPSLRIVRSIAEALKIPREDLMSHAGLRGTHEPGLSQEATDTETAIRNDPDLAPDDREMMLHLYEKLRSPKGPEPG